MAACCEIDVIPDYCFRLPKFFSSERSRSVGTYDEYGIQCRPQKLIANDFCGRGREIYMTSVILVLILLLLLIESIKK